jgi:hypothetical protein
MLARSPAGAGCNRTEPVSDVAAVALTLGEPSTDRALASLRSQTLPPAEVVLIERRTPFHRAFNSGMRSISTPFFLQLDADMVLDPDCVQRLRGAMAPDVAITVGALRDPLIGTITGVKLFRRECFDAGGLRDVIAPEVDFHLRLAERGWHTRYLLLPKRARGWELGDHDPEYTLDYVYGTYHMLGARYAAHDDVLGLSWRFGALRRSRHPLAPVARLALWRGSHARETRDVAKPRPSAADRPLLRALAAT